MTHQGTDHDDSESDDENFSADELEILTHLLQSSAEDQLRLTWLTLIVISMILVVNTESTIHLLSSTIQSYFI